MQRHHETLRSGHNLQLPDGRVKEKQFHIQLSDTPSKKTGRTASCGASATTIGRAEVERVCAWGGGGFERDGVDGISKTSPADTLTRQEMFK